jgi:hypothetical protein
MTTVGWGNVSPSSTPLGIFCRNIALFIRVGDFVAITVGENPSTHAQPGKTTSRQLGRVIDISQTRHYSVPHTLDAGQGPFLKINHFNVRAPEAKRYFQAFSMDGGRENST